MVKDKFDLTTRHTLVILEVEHGPNTVHGHDLQAEEVKWMKKYSDDINNLSTPRPTVLFPFDTPQSLDSDDTNKSSTPRPVATNPFNAPHPQSLDSNDANKPTAPRPTSLFTFGAPKVTCELLDSHHSLSSYMNQQLPWLSLHNHNR